MKIELEASSKAFTDIPPRGGDENTWVDYIAAFPSPMMLVTSYKDNGLPNACLQTFVNFMPDKDSMICIMGSVSKSGHLYKSLKHKGEFVLNFASREFIEHCESTIMCNRWDSDEIEVAGLTSEPSKCIDAPRVAECILNLECKLLWEKEHFPGSWDVVLCSKIVYVSMSKDLPQMMREGHEAGYVYNIQSANNPLGSSYELQYGALRPLR